MSGRRDFGHDGGGRLRIAAVTVVWSGCLLTLAACGDDQVVVLQQVEGRLAKMESASAAERSLLHGKIDELKSQIEYARTSIDGSMRSVTESAIARDKEAADSSARSAAAIREAIDRSSSNQLAVLERAVGSVLPIQLPPEVEARFASLEQQVADASAWPKDEAAAVSLLNQTEQLVQEIPAWAEESFLPRITALRWSSVACVAIVRSEGDTSADSADLTADLWDLLRAQPSGTPAAVSARVRALAEQRERDRKAVAFEQARQGAREIVDGTRAMNGEEEALQIDAVLGEWEGDAAVAAEVQAMRRDLRRALVNARAQSDCGTATRQWTRLRSKESSDPGVYESGVRALLASVTAARAGLAGEGVDEDPYLLLYDDLVKSVKQIEDARRQQADQMWLRYQRWALDQITAFNARFDSVEAEAAKEGSIWKRDNGGWSDERLNRIRDAMIQYLGAVNAGLLDVPLQELYRKAFDRGWKRIDAGDRQVYVAAQVATRVKKSIDEFRTEAGR